MIHSEDMEQSSLPREEDGHRHCTSCVPEPRSALTANDGRVMNAVAAKIQCDGGREWVSYECYTEIHAGADIEVKNRLAIS